MWTAEINYAAMIVAALVPMSVGFAWYSFARIRHSVGTSHRQDS